MDPIDTSVLPVAVQQALQGLPAQLSPAGTMPSSADLGASLFGGGEGATLDLSPAAQGLIANEASNEQSVTDAAHSIGLTDWPPSDF